MSHCWLCNEELKSDERLTYGDCWDYRHIWYSLKNGESFVFAKEREKEKARLAAKNDDDRSTSGKIDLSMMPWSMRLTMK
jgi:hypothetical protein